MDPDELQGERRDPSGIASRRLNRGLQRWFGSRGAAVDVALVAAGCGVMIGTAYLTQSGGWQLAVLLCVVAVFFLSRRAIRARFAITAEESATPAGLSYVSVGKGVADHARLSGGRVFVWGAPFSAGWDAISASTEQPDDYEFERYEPVQEVELFVTPAILTLTHLRIRRRWWPRTGLRADDGTFPTI